LSNLSSGHQEQIKKNRTYILHLIDIVLYLGKQGNAFRGHSEDTESLNQGMSKTVIESYRYNVDKLYLLYFLIL